VPPRATSNRRLLLFTKPARAGRVKTRLIGDLTPEQAADLHAAFVEDLLARLSGAACELHLAWALEPGEAVPGAIYAGSAGLPGLRQEGVDLGERLYSALSAAGEGAGAVAALGSDHPTLPVEIVERAFAAVEAGARVVLGPAEDGGYYLIAVAPPVPRRLFEGIDWSTPRVLDQTIGRLNETGRSLAVLPPWYDVDTPDDWCVLVGHLRAMRRAGMLTGLPRTEALIVDLG